MRETAERALRENCGDDLKVTVFGNAPCGFYKWKYPKRLKEKLNDGKLGEKVWLFRASYESGKVDNCSSDYKWALREEMDEHLENVVHKAVREVVFDED